MVVAPVVEIATVGATVSSVNTTGVLEPTLPTESVSCATMLWVPSPLSVTVVLHVPSLLTVAVPIGVVCPLVVSRSVTIVPAGARPVATDPEMVCVALLVRAFWLARVTTGGTGGWPSIVRVSVSGTFWMLSLLWNAIVAVADCPGFRKAKSAGW